jgi:hypothetical protein
VLTRHCVSPAAPSWPAIFIVCTREVPPGGELLMSYGARLAATRSDVASACIHGCEALTRARVLRAARAGHGYWEVRLRAARGVRVLQQQR